MKTRVLFLMMAMFFLSACTTTTLRMHPPYGEKSFTFMIEGNAGKTYLKFEGRAGELFKVDLSKESEETVIWLYDTDNDEIELVEIVTKTYVRGKSKIYYIHLHVGDQPVQ